MRKLVAAVAIAFSLVAVGSALVQTPRSAPRVQSVRLYVLDCGVLKRGEPTAYGLTRAQVGSTDFSDPCFLVVHPMGTLLWDVGIIPDDQIKPGGVEVAAANGTNVATTTLRSQLAAIGYAARDITYLAVSHGHADHVANANEYAGATLLIQKAEWNSMFGAEAQKLPLFAVYGALESSKTILLEGDRDVFGDSSVTLLATPGHTPGHQSLYVRLPKTGGIVLSGDLYHYPEERTLNRMPEREKTTGTAASRAALEAFMKEVKAELWIEHDIGAYAKQKKSPEYYD